MTIEIIIDGEKYDNIKEIKITDAINSIAGSFEFSTSVGAFEDAGIKEYDEVLIKIDNELILTGYIDPASISYSKNSHSMTIGGFGYLVDLVDSSIYSNTQYKGPMSFLEFCGKILKDNGFSKFSIIDNTYSSIDTSFTAEEVASAKTGDSIFDFIKKQAELKGVLLSSDGFSNLVLYNNTGTDSGVILNNRYDKNDNKFIKSGTSNYDMRKRFSKIIVKSQGGTEGFSGMARGGDNLENIQGEADDSDVKRNRVKVIISKTATDAVGCTKQAVWEVNKRRAESVKYNVTVKGHSASTGDVWKAGMKVSVFDTFADIKSIMLLNSVIYNQSKSSGTTSTLEFIANDSYNLQTEDPTKHINKIGENVI